MRIITVLLGLSLLASSVSAQPVAADYQQRSLVLSDVASLGRVQIALVRGALTVINEADSTQDHAKRLRMAGHALRDPEFVARRMISVIAASSQVAVTYDASTTPPTVMIAITDSQLQTLIDNQWTKFADAFVPVQSTP